MLHERLWQGIGDVWSKILAHHFLVELQEGSLPRPVFAYYLGQDYAYLEDFARVLALGAARSPSGEDLRLFLAAAQEILAGEQDLHRALTDALGGDARDLGSTIRGVDTQKYSDFLFRHGFEGDYARLVMAVLPCFWVYREVGQALKSQGTSPDPLYQEWVESYAGDAYGRTVQALITVADRLGGEQPQRQGEFCDIFRQGVWHEHAFWDQAYRISGR